MPLKFQTAYARMKRITVLHVDESVSFLGTDEMVTFRDKLWEYHQVYDAEEWESDLTKQKGIDASSFTSECTKLGNT
jgi:hypothetical protein